MSREHRRGPHIEGSMQGAGRPAPLDRILFQSFRLSQGNEGTQMDLFKWLRLTGDYEGLNVPDTIDQAVATIIPKGRHAYIDQHEIELARNEAKSELLKAIGEGKPEFSREELLARIFVGYLERDFQFVKSKRESRADGKLELPSRTTEHVNPPEQRAPADSLDDPHASWLRRYVLSGRSTGVPGFDQLHREMRPLLLAALQKVEHMTGEVIHNPDFAIDEDPEVTNPVYLRSLQANWEKHHPGESFISASVRAEMDQLAQSENAAAVTDVFATADMEARFGEPDQPLAVRKNAYDTQSPPRTRKQGK